MRHEFPKVCSCGRSYTRAQWKKLPDQKIWRWPWGEVLELRNCVCKSTMSVTIREGEPEDLPGVKLVDDLEGVPAWIRAPRRTR